MCLKNNNVSHLLLLFIYISYLERKFDSVLETWIYVQSYLDLIPGFRTLLLCEFGSYLVFWNLSLQIF